MQKNNFRSYRFAQKLPRFALRSYRILRLLRKLSRFALDDSQAYLRFYDLLFIYYFCYLVIYSEGRFFNSPPKLGGVDCPPARGGLSLATEGWEPWMGCAYLQKS